MHAPLPHRSPRSKVLGLAALTAVALGALATPASATDEFPSKPSATASLACVQGDPFDGPVLTLDLGNVGGLSSAHFEVARTDVATIGYDVAQGATTTVEFEDHLAENDSSTLTVTGDDGFSYTETFTVDCSSFVGDITLTCDGLTPVVSATATATGELGDEVFLDDAEYHTLAEGRPEPGETVILTAEVANDVPFDLRLEADADGTLDALADTPHCRLPAPTTSTTVPTPPSTTPSTSTTPVVVVPAPTEPGPVRAQQVTAPLPPAAPTELARTGSDTLPLAVTGIVLLIGGALLRRRSLRLGDAG